MTVCVLGYIKKSDIYFKCLKRCLKVCKFSCVWRGKSDVLVKYNSGDLGFFNCMFYL